MNGQVLRFITITKFKLINTNRRISRKLIMAIVLKRKLSIRMSVAKTKWQICCKTIVIFPNSVTLINILPDVLIS